MSPTIPIDNVALSTFYFNISRGTGGLSRGTGGLSRGRERGGLARLYGMLILLHNIMYVAILEGLSLFNSIRFTRNTKLPLYYILSYIYHYIHICIHICIHVNIHIYYNIITVQNLHLYLYILNP